MALPLPHTVLCASEPLEEPSVESALLQKAPASFTETILSVGESCPQLG